ncbi:MAG: type II toxin-antitoxin system PemK/MazF family toxin [Crocosphaera sp.]
MVKVDFPRVKGIKRRPAVVVSSTIYNTTRPDVILGLITTKTAL